MDDAMVQLHPWQVPIEQIRDPDEIGFESTSACTLLEGPSGSA